MIPSSVLRPIPAEPGVYCLYGGQSRRWHEAYVGVAGNLRQRLTQHLIRRDSSVTTGATVVSLNPDLVTLVRWWTHKSFEPRENLEAAELVAFDVLNPVMRSRSPERGAVVALAADPDFRTKMTTLFEGPPTGSLELPTMETLLRDLKSLRERLDHAK